MTGVRDFGRYFEEFVMDYLKTVEKIDLVEMEYPYKIKIPQEKAKETKSARNYPSDIDIIGLRNNEIWIVECKEHINKNDVSNIKKKFGRIKKSEKIKKFHNKNIKKFVACITKTKTISKKDFRDVELLSFKDMIKQLIKATKKQKGLVTLGKYHWFFERLKRPDTKGCLDNLLSCLETSK